MIKPLGTRVLIRKIKKNPTGIIITTAIEEVDLSIEAIGPYCTEDIKVGDKIVIEKYTGTPVEEDFLIVDEKQIVAVI
jgi:co-chaperonin GroES (HSP10)